MFYSNIRYWERHAFLHIKYLGGDRGLCPLEVCRSSWKLPGTIACCNAMQVWSLYAQTHQWHANESYFNLCYHFPLASLVFLKDSLVSRPTFLIISLPLFFWLDVASIVLRSVYGWVCLDHIFGWCITHHVCSLAPTNKTLKRFFKRLRKFLGYQTAFIKITFLWLKM